MTITTDRVLTLGEAVKLTGFSAGKFRYNRDTLVSEGVTVTPEGWSIPLSVLNRIGWVGVKAPKGEVVDTPLSVAQARVVELETEVAHLRAELEKKHRGIFGRRK